MKKTAKLTVLAICAALAASAASCGNTTATALTVNGKDIRAGIYIYYQMQALSEAESKLSEEQPDLDQNSEDFDIFKQSVESTPVSDWVNNRANELCREFAAKEAKFDEFGLSLTAEENAEIKSYVNSMWTEENIYAQYLYGVDVMSEYYEKYGIGKQSFQDIYTLSYKEKKIFSHLYGEGGTQEVSAEELNTSVKENYALVKYFEVDLTDQTAQYYVDKLNGGTPFAEVKQEYDMAKELEEVNAAMKEAEAAGEEYTGKKPEEITAELAEESSLQTVIKKDSTSPSEDFVKAVFEMAAGENKVITVSEETSEDGAAKSKTYAVSRLDITSDESVMEARRETELHSLKDEEFNKMISDLGAGYEVSENSAAIKKYKPENLTKKD